MSGEPVLQLVDATILKNGVPIVDRVTLTIRAGEHTAILGPNGAGKSALVRLLTHHEYAVPEIDDDAVPPVRVFGHHRWNVFELRSQLGVVSADMHHRFVSGNSAGHMSGETVVLSGLFATHGFFKPDAIDESMRGRAEAALERMDARHLAGRMMNELSSGEARRVLIARALVTDPRALVLDEPTTGLDFVARHRFLDLVERIAAGGTTLILVTHHVEEIVPSVERVVLLTHGRVAREGSKAAMLTDANLTDVFDAPVRVERRGDRYVAVL